MLRKLIGAISIVALLIVLGGVSYANVIQITIGQSTTGTAAATNNGTSFSGGVSGFAYQGSNTGTYWLSNATLTGTGCNFVCTLSANSETLTVAIGSETLVGILSLDTEALDAFLQGSLYISSSTPGFASIGYAPGNTVAADLVVAGGRISSGEIQTDSVPEPGSIALVGSGLLAIAGVLRRRWL